VGRTEWSETRLNASTGLIALGLAIALVGAILAAADLAAFALVTRARLRHLAESGVGAAKRLLPLLERPEPVIAALAAVDVLLSTIAVLCAIGLGPVLALPPPLARLAPLEEYLVVGLVVVGLLAGHALAWAVALARPEGVALALARISRLLLAFSLPLVGWPAFRLVQRLGGRAQPPAEASQRELQKLVEVVEENGVLEAGEQRMIHRIVEMGERMVREVMVPRIDMVAVPEETPVREVLDRIRATGHSRIPVYAGSIDNITGILYAKDLLNRLPTISLDAPVGPLARPAHFVPETKKVDELLREMQEMKVHMAIVVDEYGGTAGLITIEDLLEEIVGEIRDEYDISEESWIEPISDREAIFDARVSIHDVNQTLALHLSDEEYDTLGGLVYARLGKVPEQGDVVRVDNAVVSVLSTAGRRIRKVRVTVEPPSPNGAEG